MTAERTWILARDPQYNPFAREMGMSDTDLYAICMDFCEDCINEES